MRPLTLDDLLPLEEFADRRREFFESHSRYIDLYRRVRIGPALVLIFENRQTLWFRVQEILRITRLSDPRQVQQELDVYNRLLPLSHQLQAALLIQVDQERRFTEELATWQALRGDELCFCLGEKQLPAALLTCRPEDRAMGAAHWVQFTVETEARQLLADFRLTARFEISHASYQHRSSALNEEVRQSLLDDLVLSDRD